MRIAYITPFYSPIIGGVEKVVREVSEYISSSSHEAFVLTYNRKRKGGKGTLPWKEKINGVNVIRIMPTFSWSHGSYSPEVEDVLIELDPDIVHAHVWRHPHIYQVARLKEEMDFRAVFHGHANFHRFDQVGVITWLYHRFADFAMREFLEKFDRFIALTPHESEILVDKLDVKREKIEVIPNGIDIDPTLDPVSDSEPFLFYLGRISKSKNINLLLEAVKLVNRKFEIGLRMAGPDEGLASNINAYTKKQDLDIQYLGVISEEEKLEMYKKCKLFVHPAVYEPFGITLLEAQAFGKPCVITGSGGQLYAAPPGKTSKHAGPDPEDYAQAILSLLENEELSKRLSKNARNWAGQHTWARILPRYEKIYSKLVD